MLSFLLAGLLLAPAPSYSAVVVDATTNRPLAGVSVRAGAGATTTDARGSFTLGGSPTALDLSHVGYAALHAIVPAQSSGADTLRLLPQSYVLENVAVRPPRAVTFSTVPKDGPDMGRRLYPGQSVALLVERPAASPADQPCVVSEVRLYLREKVKQGRLRVRLVNIQRDGDSSRPGTNDLLPIPTVFSTQQLAAAPKGQLVLDLSAYNLLVPAAGLCVIVDCLPTDPAAQTATRVDSDGKGHTTVTMAGRQYPADEFPMLDGKRGVGSRTWSRFAERPEWTTRATLFYSVRTDVSVFTY